MSILFKIESLLYKEFETVPFHNLFMLNNKNIIASNLGGTCSDKVLHFQKVLSNNEIKTTLHSAIINEKECHRMLSVSIENKQYFIEVGSGWPCIKLFPAFDFIDYHVFGMSFKTTLMQDNILLYHKTDNDYKLMLTIPLNEKKEEEIKNDIEKRFEDKSIYPFQNSLRFSKIIENKFFFLKGNRLRIFQEKSISEKVLTKEEIFDLITNTFKFDLAKLEYYCID